MEYSIKGVEDREGDICYCLTVWFDGVEIDFQTSYDRDYLTEKVSNKYAHFKEI